MTFRPFQWFNLIFVSVFNFVIGGPFKNLIKARRQLDFFHDPSQIQVEHSNSLRPFRCALRRSIWKQPIPPRIQATPCPSPMCLRERVSARGYKGVRDAGRGEREEGTAVWKSTSTLQVGQSTSSLLHPAGPVPLSFRPVLLLRESLPLRRKCLPFNRDVL